VKKELSREKRNSSVKKEQKKEQKRNSPKTHLREAQSTQHKRAPLCLSLARSLFSNQASNNCSGGGSAAAAQQQQQFMSRRVYNAASHKETKLPVSHLNQQSALSPVAFSMATLLEGICPNEFLLPKKALSLLVIVMDYTLNVSR
jgi:hypothetical protein